MKCVEIKQTFGITEHERNAALELLEVVTGTLTDLPFGAAIAGYGVEPYQTGNEVTREMTLTFANGEKLYLRFKSKEKSL